VNFDRAFDILLGHEGGFVADSRDPGGATRWGVTQRVALQEGYTGDMRVFPVEMAKTIARKRYWDAVKADDLPEALRFSVFDAAYNSGPPQAIRWLQRALDVVDDGLMGPTTLAAANACDPVKTAAVMNGERLDFLTSLPTWGHFSRGWARRIASNLKSL
jgi:lysozyme family protein